ncbi:MAG: DUF547 domain-containing protein [Myxococcota bacterium]|nr:DUF547 domain-containing protein [Myxococcota bacterium]
MRKLSLLLLLAIFALPSIAAADMHAPFNALLKANVRGDKVNYNGFKGNASFQSYLSALESADISSMSRNEKLAFWINAYNATMIKVVLANPGKRSVRDMGPGNFGIFKVANHKVAGQMVSLDKIENGIIRPTFKEPRIHAALNCASISCPPLANFAFTGAKVNAQLQKVFTRFARDKSRNQISAGGVALSQIFKWYAADFGGPSGVAAYLSKFISDAATKSALSSGSIGFAQYNWGLNNL